MEITTQKKTIIFLVSLEITLLIILFSFFPKDVLAGFGVGNVTVITNLTIGNVFPEMSNMSVENTPTLTLIPNNTRKTYCWGLATDFNGWNDIVNGTAEFLIIQHPFIVGPMAIIFIILMSLVY